MVSKNFSINSEYQNVSSVCFVAKTFCEENGVSDSTVREVELCLAEALNNIIKHSYKGEPGNKIYIDFTHKEDEFKIKLTDFGEARKNLDKPTLEFDPEDIDSLPEGGMGLFIIDQIMNKTSYEIEGNQNIFTMIKKYD
ncbi:MAG: hypothetical protein CR986_05955 [Ignavibacteriae bacterium]|nr:MAG: hypothetical protein CR986_05955 [Ignavibacteriota bacterium]